ncbi:ATP-grasp domain-containing protein [Nannocystis bainbridge]|uniref:ATP-grasp domain-containing protein n=1 Tax=Nannocystis bainbridge TaxID=2995303 RepID=A0ABT5E9V0_9BACT|nr:ATP-grasp domain-containing protein [Nannocystis bainbridge]MDC0722620.1 ATP-grasp domain-containing protein [Nannocystis bainbridge]
MRVLFCTDPLLPRSPDRAFAPEVAAADAAGLAWSCCDFEALVGGDVGAALRRVPASERIEVAIYRGWMMPLAAYDALHAGLLARGLQLVNDPAAHRSAHLLPAALPHLGDDTPATVVLPLAAGLEDSRIAAALAPFGARALIVKDYVKSRKHEWNDACFIRAADDDAEVRRVVGNFLARQGEDLVGGLVFRAYEPLVPLGNDPRSDMPLPREWRRFIADGRPLIESPAWEIADSIAPPEFTELARRVPCRFFSLDLAERAAGGWTAIELGDGQVAGLPPRMDPAQFYRALAAWDPQPLAG